MCDRQGSTMIYHINVSQYGMHFFRIDPIFNDRERALLVAIDLADKFGTSNVTLREQEENQHNIDYREEETRINQYRQSLYRR